MYFACIISYSGDECGSVLRLGGGRKNNYCCEIRGLSAIPKAYERGEKVES